MVRERNAAKIAKENALKEARRADQKLAASFVLPMRHDTVELTDPELDVLWELSTLETMTSG